MCRYAYDKRSSLTNKTMIFCHLQDTKKTDYMKLCISQKFCSDGDRFVEVNQKRDCKYYK